jgi:hypothetical protein
MPCVVGRTFLPPYSGTNSPIPTVQLEDLMANLVEKKCCPCQELDHDFSLV